MLLCSLNGITGCGETGKLLNAQDAGICRSQRTFGLTSLLAGAGLILSAAPQPVSAACARLLPRVMGVTAGGGSGLSAASAKEAPIRRADAGLSRRACTKRSMLISVRQIFYIIQAPPGLSCPAGSVSCEQAPQQ